MLSKQNITQQLTIFSLNHKSCPLNSLGKISTIKPVIDELIPSFVEEESIQEIVPIATCNRLEFVIACSDISQAQHAILKHLSNYLEHTYAEIKHQSQFFVNDEAVSHLFHLVSSLESLVIGDAQILGQVKQAYNEAVDNGTVGKTLHTLFQKSFAVAKKIRTQTGLGKGRVSISALAVDYIRRQVLDCSTASVAVIGAGKMGALCIKYLQDQSWKKITMVNRTVSKCQPFADEFGIDIAPLDQLHDVLGDADVVISATSAAEFVVTKDHVEQAHRMNTKPRLFIDISMPPDIDPQIASEHSTVVGLDDLRALADENQSQRSASMKKAEAILLHEIQALGTWPMILQIDSIAAEMGEYACNVLEEETNDLFETLSHLSIAERDLIIQKVSRIAERLVLTPRRMLREAANGKLSPESVEILDEVFKGCSQQKMTAESETEI